MADKVSRFAPTGSMDKDSDPRYVGKGDSNGDYIDARNIQCVPQDGNENGTISPTLGNEFAFSLGSVSQQNKRYRLTFDGDPLKQHEVRFLSTQRDADMVTPNGPNGGLMFNGTVTSFTTAFNTAISGSGVSWVLSTSTPGAVEIELASYPMYQWYIDSVGTDILNPIIIAEAIPVDLSGPLKDIGSFDLLGDLFIHSTTQDNEPTELPITITAIGPTLFGGTIAIGPITYLTFSAPHNMVQGQWIRITESGNPWLNGSFLVSQVLSPTQIGIPTVLAWGGTLPQVAPGPEIVTVNPNGIGEIGVARKDENTDSWTYIRLLRSVELNYVSKWQVDCDAEKGVDSVAIYFDDDYNPYRSFYYSGEYITDGAIAVVNSLNVYSYGNISTQIYGLGNLANIFLDFVSQSPSGGVLKAGNYRYFVVLKDYSDNDTEPSDLSNTVVVYSDQQSAIAVGDDANTITTKSNNILVSGINVSVYEKIAIGYYSIVGGAVVASLLPFNYISSSEYAYRHTGLEEETSYDVGIFAAKSIGNYEFAKNINIIDQRVVRSNLRKKNTPDLAAFFKTIKHAVCVHSELNANGGPLATNPAGEFKDPSNVFYKSGYMFNETYRFSGRAIFKNGSTSDWYWVDDIRIDPFLTNQANPSDNRRDQAVPNAATSFDLVENITPSTYPITGHARPFGSYFDNQGLQVTPQGGENQFLSNDSLFSHKNILVPYIEFFDINLSYSIDGQPVSGIIEYIEFGRAEVVKEVLSTGVAVGSVKLLTTQEVPMGVDDEPSIGGIYRGYSMFGSFTLSFTYPTVNLGIGTRANDLDGANETYHEYPFVYSSFPLSGMVQGNVVAGTAFANEVTDFYKNSFIFEYAQPLGDWFNVFMGINFQNNSGFPFPDTSSIFYPSNTGVDFYRADIMEVNQMSGIGTPFKQPNFNDTMRSERRIWTIYSPDLIFGNEEGVGSVVIDFGEMFLDATQTSNSFHTRGGVNLNNTHMPSCVTKYYPENLSNTYNEYVIDEMRNVSDGDRVNLFGFNGFRKAHDAYTFLDNSFYGNPQGGAARTGFEGLWKMIKSPVIYVENGGNGIVSQGKNNDHSVRYVQLFTKKDNKYGPIEESSYYSTGTRVRVSGIIGTIGPSVVKVFGGDTFTQQSYLKTKYADYSVAPGAGPDPDWDFAGTLFPTDKGPGFAGGLVVYTQNRRNSQLRYDTPEQFIYLKDTTSLGEWAWDFELIDKHTYSDIFDSVSNSNIVQINGNAEVDLSKFDFPTRITWSQKKIYGEKIDSYRAFYPFDIKDLTLAFGEIFHHDNINGELFTLQPRKWQRQLFNTRGELQVTGSSIGALIGDGSVLSRDGQTLSSYGTQNKWSCQKGKSQGGSDILCWYNSENGLFLRFGADGTVVLSNSRKMRNFSRSVNKWIHGKDTPAYNQGIRTVWDDRSKEMIWTFTGWRSLEQWVLPTLFLTTTPVGLVLRNDNAPSDSFEEFPRFFRCILTHVTSAQSEPGVGVNWQTYWEQISYDDTNYYSIFTLAHNEATDGFSTFYGHIPKTYLKWRDTFLSSHPTERNLIYEHRRGLPTTWYESDATPPKVEDAFVEAVFNDLPEESKRFISAEILSENVPDRIEYRTKSQYTWSEPADFKVNDDQFRGFILNDATVSQDPRGNTRRMDGDYIKAKFFFIGGTMNKLYSMVVKLRGRLRDFRQ